MQIADHPIADLIWSSAMDYHLIFNSQQSVFSLLLIAVLIDETVMAKSSSASSINYSSFYQELHPIETFICFLFHSSHLRNKIYR